MGKKNKTCPTPSFHTLAEGYCKSIENGKRLIDDGKILLEHGRYLGAINSFHLATEEIIKAHLLNQPVSYRTGDQKWEWLWSAFRNHSVKQKIILLELHRNNPNVLKKFNEIAKAMLSIREDSIYVNFDDKNGKFLSPQESLSFVGDLQSFAAHELSYANAIFQLFTISGMPTVDQIEKVFVMQHKVENK